MPLLGSNTIRALYDVSAGGPPTAYQCQLRIATIKHSNGEDACLGCEDCSIQCRRVTRTLRGMRTHQRVVHGIREQSEFNFGEIKATI